MLNIIYNEKIINLGRLYYDVLFSGPTYIWYGIYLKNIYFKFFLIKINISLLSKYTLTPLGEEESTITVITSDAFFELQISKGSFSSCFIPSFFIKSCELNY